MTRLQNSAIISYGDDVYRAPAMEVELSVSDKGRTKLADPVCACDGEQGVVGAQSQCNSGVVE